MSPTAGATCPSAPAGRGSAEYPPCAQTVCLLSQPPPWEVGGASPRTKPANRRTSRNLVSTADTIFPKHEILENAFAEFTKCFW